MKKELVKKICLALLFLSVSFNISYWAFAKYDVYSDLNAIGDAEHYMNMSRQEFTNVGRRYYNRFLVPSIASFLNQNLEIEKFLPAGYENVSKKSIQLNFGIINILALGGTAFMLFFFCKDLKFSEWESLAGCFLFFTSFFVINYYTAPLVDAAGCFFLLACIYAILRERSLWLFLAFLLGVFVKESTLIVLLFIIINEKKIFTKKLLVCLPGVVLYALFLNTGKGFTGANDFYALINFHSYKNNMLLALKDYSLYRLLEIIQTYMFLWILFFYSLFKYKKPAFLRKHLWFIIMPFFIALFMGSAVAGRILFYSFPIVIPLALLALRDILETENIKSYKN